MTDLGPPPDMSLSEWYTQGLRSLRSDVERLRRQFEEAHRNLAEVVGRNPGTSTMADLVEEARSQLTGMRERVLAGYDEGMELILDAPLNFTVPVDGLSTIRDYLVRLLLTTWHKAVESSSQRPFGNGGWECDLYIALISAQMIDGRVDMNGLELAEGEQERADKMIEDAIRYLGRTR